MIDENSTPLGPNDVVVVVDDAGVVDVLEDVGVVVSVVVVTDDVDVVVDEPVEVATSVRVTKLAKT